MGLYIWGRKDLLVRANLRFLAPGRLHILIDMTNIMTLGWDFFSTTGRAQKKLSTYVN